MATPYDRLYAPDRRNARIADLWWAMALRGVGAIVLGTLAVLWPGITLLVLAGVFAAYCLVDAAFSIILAVRGARRQERWGWPVLHSLVAIAAAVLTIFYPDLTVFAFVALLTVWALATGTIAIVGAFRLHPDHGRVWMILAGIVSLALGVLLLLFPQVGMFTLTWMIAFQAWLAGSMLLSLAFRLRMRQAERRTHGRRVPASE
ncbi:uncharacterized membrane protein HdeD (DUF308 family) [Sphingomonas trueperi]|uniref:HdeD family acid-resistance protein n=1 Tax=Sphingomonas trueperi TaxID=53317 RepID=UPI0033944E4A